MDIINPATESLICSIEVDTPLSIKEKIISAKQALSPWKETDLKERKIMIKRFQNLLKSHQNELAIILTQETGKPISQSHNELNAVHEQIHFFLEKIDDILYYSRTYSLESSLEEQVTYDPLGVIANISSWNFPYFMGVNVFIPALLTGNTVLYKPSEFSTLSGIKIAQLLWASGFPKGVFDTVLGDGKIGASLIESDINAVFFTGSYKTGKNIALAAAPRMLKVQLELGGKDAAYICEDVSPQTVASALAYGAFYNNGQSCCSIDRIYVHQKIAPHFIKEFLTQVKNLPLGAPENNETYIGPLSGKIQISHLESQIREAKALGAQVLCGGRPLDYTGYYFPPTVLSNVNAQMRIMQEESFGPLVGIQVVENDDEALEEINKSSYGLTTSIYCTERQRAKKILSRVESRTVYWNCCDRVSPKVSWSASRLSELGLALGLERIQCFLRARYWHLNPGL
ncbi:MAG: aldehyde dehydrogenase [Waddliaceae bacterium]|nr:aldehyde dehydrogenase [Waddliaceae bacterium]